MKKITLLFALLFMVLLYLWYAYDTIPKDSTPHNIQPITQNSVATPPVLPKAKYKDTSDIEVVKNHQIKNHQTNKSYAIFEEIDIDSVLTSITPIEDVKPIAALGMKKNSIKKIEIGDTVVLPSIDGSDYALTITHKDISSRGNVSIDGSFSENGITYSAILTEGTNAAFISMNTPEGTYEAELVNGIGYIYTSSDIVKAKVDPSKLDEIMPH
jgi:hypothetical protein